MNQPFANIHPEAKIGPGVVIEPFSTVTKDVEIGEGTWVGPNVTIMDGARIGKNCRIFPGAVVSAIPQDLKFANEETLAIIGDNVTIRECVTVNRGTKASWKTVVGNNTLLMAYSHVAHDCEVGNHCILANSVNLAGHVIIEDFAILGGLSAVHQFVRIGAHVMVAGGCLVRKDVPPFTMAARNPVSFAGINLIGLRRRGFTTEQINDIRAVYNILFQQRHNVTNGVKLIESELPESPVRQQILEFIAKSQRGLMKGYSGTADLGAED